MDTNNNSSMNNAAIDAFDRARRYGLGLLIASGGIGISSIVAPPLVTSAFVVAASAATIGFVHNIEQGRKALVRFTHE